MASRKRFTITSMIGVAAAAAVSVSTALGARAQPKLTLFLRQRGIEFVTPTGSSSAYPGHLQIGDRIFSDDALVQGTRSVGYDNELCTVTFDHHELCLAVAVLAGKGQFEASWLETDWPSGYTGVIDGGTGTFARAKGSFTATPLPGGALKLVATLT
jgi:hypothetical protein